MRQKIILDSWGYIVKLALFFIVLEIVSPSLLSAKPWAIFIGVKDIRSADNSLRMDGKVADISKRPEVERTFEKTIFLSGALGEEHSPTWKTVKSTIAAIAAEQPESLFVYYGGHAHDIHGLSLQDTIHNRPNSYLSEDEFLSWLFHGVAGEEVVRPAAKNVFVVLEACNQVHRGYLSAAGKQENPEDLPQDTPPGMSSFYVMRTGQGLVQPRFLSWFEELLKDRKSYLNSQIFPVYQDSFPGEISNECLFTDLGNDHVLLIDKTPIVTLKIDHKKFPTNVITKFEIGGRSIEDIWRQNKSVLLSPDLIGTNQKITITPLGWRENVPHPDGPITDYWLPQEIPFVVQSGSSFISCQGPCVQKASCIQLPKPSLSFSPSSGYAPLTVNVDTTGSISPNGRITEREIISSEGHLSPSAKASLSFVKVGTHTISLVVTDNKGCSQSISQAVEVKERPTIIKSSEIQGEVKSGKQTFSHGYVSLEKFNAQQSPGDNNQLIILDSKKRNSSFLKAVKLQKGKVVDENSWNLSNEYLHKEELLFSEIEYAPKSKYIYLINRNNREINILNRGTGVQEMKLSLSDGKIMRRGYFTFSEKRFRNEEPSIQIAFFSRTGSERNHYLHVINIKEKDLAKEPVSIKLRGEPTSSPAIFYDGSVFFGASEGEKHSLAKYKKGKIDYFKKLNGRLDYKPFFAGDFVFFITKEQNRMKLASINAKSLKHIENHYSWKGKVLTEPQFFSNPTGDTNYLAVALKKDDLDDFFCPTVFAINENDRTVGLELSCENKNQRYPYISKNANIRMIVDEDSYYLGMEEDGKLNIHMIKKIFKKSMNWENFASLNESILTRNRQMGVESVEFKKDKVNMFHNYKDGSQYSLWRATEPKTKKLAFYVLNHQEDGSVNVIYSLLHK